MKVAMARHLVVVIEPPVNQRRAHNEMAGAQTPGAADWQ
jgi:hypothetical protein